MRIARSHILGWIWLVLLLPVGGCICGGATTEQIICFSPDGQTVAYLRESFGGFGHMMVLATGWSSQHVCWSPADARNKQRKLAMHNKLWAMVGGESSGGLPETAEALLFSPDSRHLAVATDERIIVIETATGRHWRIEDRAVPHSLHWTGKSQLGWCNLTFPDDAREPIWRVLTSHIPPVAKPVERYQTEGASDMQAQWSPDGRYLILAAVSVGPDLCAVLDLQTAEVRYLKLPLAAFCGAAWRRDSKAAVLFFQRLKYRPELQQYVGLTRKGMTALSLDLAQWRTRQWKPGKGGRLDDVRSYKPAPVWTRDNRHVILRSTADRDYHVFVDPHTGKEPSVLPKVRWLSIERGGAPELVDKPTVQRASSRRSFGFASVEWGFWGHP